MANVYNYNKSWKVLKLKKSCSPWCGGYPHPHLRSIRKEMLFASAPASFHHACIRIWKKRTLCGCPIFNKVHRVLLWLKKCWLVQDHKIGNHGDELDTLENCKININGEILKPTDSSFTVNHEYYIPFYPSPLHVRICAYRFHEIYMHIYISVNEKRHV